MTDTAGRWEEEYPDNCLVGDDVIKHLRKMAEYQKEREKEIAEQIRELSGGNICDPKVGGLLFWHPLFSSFAGIREERRRPRSSLVIVEV